MKLLTERDLNAYLTQRESKPPISRFLGGRVFRGVVQSTSFVSGWLFMITVTRNGDSVPDLTLYACNIPGYLPNAGDTVDLLWRSANEAIVLQPVSAPVYKFRATMNAAQTSSSGVWTTANTFTNVDATTFDPHGDFNLATHQYIVPVPGTYLFVAARTTTGSTAGRFGVRFLVNGVTIVGQVLYPSPTASPSCGTTSEIQMAAGDTIEAQVFQDQANGTAIAVNEFAGHLLSP